MLTHNRVREVESEQFDQIFQAEQALETKLIN